MINWVHRLKKVALGLAPLLAFAPLPSWAGPFWDWQLQGPGNPPAGVSWFGMDLDEATPQHIAALNARGITTICYVSVGTVEEWRSDAGEFPPALVGRAYEGWDGENFLDIRNQSALLPLMAARFARCAELGFAAVEPDNMDVHINDSGFDVSAADAVSYVKALAGLAHGLGLKIGQKNVPDLTGPLIGSLDFVITEGCFADGWCDQVLAYQQAGKPVLAAEYEGTGVDFAAACAYGRQTGIHFILKDWDLTARLTACD